MRRIALAVGAVSGLILVSALSASMASASGEIRTYTGGRFYLDIGGERGLIGSAEGGDRHQQRIEIESWSWGAAGAAQHRAGGSNQMSMDDTAGKEKSPASFGEWIADVERPAASGSPYRANDRLRNAGPRNGNAARGDPDRPVIVGSVPNASRPGGANETITIGGGRTETASGQATGKRQHMPIRTRAYYDKPQGEGSVWIRVSTPWAACRAGARYPSLSLTGAAEAYVLDDVTVARCGGGEVALTYKKVTVRAWDPKKKEE